ncbi:ATP-binding cassette domain-containing protein [Halalkalibacter akibai]|uniref:ABC transporter ATP-binding protein n=1 Tax=Halalkalibacter akibai (strain ATCC 43226 / DSM 21942 / CIP 109018 / JCM 9157 / 1139) TaxID=1236973 RepID=W4QQG2_HALA3|nr:ATP-binding cassette domain-containing protein [Halalkalibacter akibai]GAE34316.1 ATPase component CbiO of energizing module of cobalt ECF transporter [Halalkalibacter akibai JCM 9157]
MHAIEINQLSFEYQDGTKAVDQITLNIPMGAKVAILGPNGAGKSTFLHHLNGLKLPQSGTVSVMGIPLTKQNLKAIRQKVGLVFQDPDDQVFSATVLEDVQFGPRNLGMSEQEIEDVCRASLGSVGMLEFKHKAPFHLSYGQKKRVAIAGILAMKPDIVVLDEPMSYLDPQGKDDVAALLQGLNFMGKTIILSTHDVDFAASWADIIILMREGQLLTTGGPELLVNEEWIRKANLHLPTIARLFRMLGEKKLPVNEQEAARMLYKILYSEATSVD